MPNEIQTVEPRISRGLRDLLRLISDELTQFDLDSAGTDSEVADTEIMAGMCDTLPALDAGRYLVRFSSRANG
jgi:hypothetical protein